MRGTSFSNIIIPKNIDILLNNLTNERGCIARGSGLSYNDASQNAGGTVINMKYFNKIIDISSNGIVHCQSGVLLKDINAKLMIFGYFVPVTPGTEYVTIGGMVASDVHGKNHHSAGSFGNYIKSIELVNNNGDIIVCKPSEELFNVTVGGMGISGIILSIKFQAIPISSSYIDCYSIKTKDINESIEKLTELDNQYQYTVAWLDGRSKNGRGIITCGNHSNNNNNYYRKHVINIGIPFNIVNFINPLSTLLFNSVWYNKPIKKESTVYYKNFFYPLDAVKNWNRIYGQNGFIQYQFILPFDKVNIIKYIFNELSQYYPSLIVLKRFGLEGSGYLSFPKPGYTLSFDIPIKDVRINKTLIELDNLILQSDGRLYLAKDGRASQDIIKNMYDKCNIIKKVIKNGKYKFSSDLIRRVLW